MESTANFQAGLKAAYDELNQDGKLTENDRQVVGKLLANPVMQDKRGNRFFAMKRAHFRMRRFYARKTGRILPFEIDWTAIVEWIKENWVDIVKILLTVLIFVI